MTAQHLEIGGQKMVVLSHAEFKRLRDAAENYEDICAAVDGRERAAAGEEFVPSELINRILDGESGLKVWREHRGHTQDGLAGKLGKQGSWLAKLENGKLKGDLGTWRALARELNVELDDIAPLD